MRRTTILLATSTCLAVLLAVAGSGSAAFGAAGRGARHRAAIPAGFRAQSVSFLSSARGWMLGSAPCGQNTCTTVVGTTNGGGTWSKLGTLNAPLTLEDGSGVTEVRFADDLHGWAFDPAMWSTTDGGVTWTKQTPPGGRPLVALAADADAAYAVVSACGFGRPISNCAHPTTLYRSTPGGSWSRVPLTLPVTNQAILAVHGLVAYVVVPAALIDHAGTSSADALDVTVDGHTWSSRPDPCNPANGEHLTSIAPISDTDVALLCQGDIGFGKAAKHVLRSRDNGQTTASAGWMPLYGIVTQLAAAPDGTLVAASYSIGSWIYRNAGGKTWTTQEDLGDGGMGWNDVLFTSDRIGFVVHGPAACCGGNGPGELWKTHDGGLTWAPI